MLHINFYISIGLRQKSSARKDDRIWADNSCPNIEVCLELGAKFFNECCLSASEKIFNQLTNHQYWVFIFSSRKKLIHTWCALLIHLFRVRQYFIGSQLPDPSCFSNPIRGHKKQPYTFSYIRIRLWRDMYLTAD